MKVCDIIALAALALPFTAGASPIYDNLGSSGTGTTVSSTSWAANTFTTGSAATLADVIVSLEGISSATGSVTVALYSDVSNAPGMLLSTLGTIQDNDSRLSTSAFNNVTFGGNNYSLAATTEYYIVLSGTSTGDVLWQRSSNTSGTGVAGNLVALSPDGGTTWFPSTLNSDHLPFVMEVDPATGVPEPNTIFGALGGFVAIAIARLRQRG